MTEGFNKLPLMRELSPKVTEGEKSLIHFDLRSGNPFCGGSRCPKREARSNPFRDPPPYSKIGEYLVRMISAHMVKLASLFSRAIKLY